MSTPVRGPDGPLGYAPPKARQQAGTAGRSGTASDGRGAAPVSPLQGLADDLKPPRIAAAPAEETQDTTPPSRDSLPSRDTIVRRDALLSRDTASLRETPRDLSPLRDALSPREPSPLRDALLPRDPSPLRDALLPRDPSPLRDALLPRDPSPLRDALLPRDPSPLRDALLPRDPSPLRDTLMPRETSPLRRTPSNDALSSRDSVPLRDTLSPTREPTSLRDALASSLQDALSSRDVTPPREPLSSRDTSPQTILSPRDVSPKRDTLASRDAARDVQFGRELVSRDTGPRTLLDEAADMGLAPSREDVSHWDVPLPPPPPGATSASGADSTWKRKKRSDAFEGDTALKELRTRLATAPGGDQAPEPPLAPPKGPIFASVVRLMGVMVLAAAGALGFLWITSPHGSRTAIQETTLVSLRNFEPQTRSAPSSASTAKPAPVAQNVVADPAPAPSPTADKPWAVANYTNDATEKAMAPAGLSPRMAGPPRGPVVNRVVISPPVQPAPAAVAAPAPPPPAPVPAPTPVVAAPTPAPSADRDEIAALVMRARTYLAAGDVAAARLVLRRAAEREDPQAALALGGTYDPTVLKRLGIISFHADPSQARDWYRRAAALGSADASLRLEQLVQTDR
jgi:hypothetical protein